MSTSTPYGQWLPFPPRTGAERRLLVFPCAGQGASAYRSWQRHLGPAIDVVPVQLPGREGRATEPPYRDMDCLLADLLPALDDQLTRDYALFGHSMGAVVAFETARRMQAAGRPPRHLLVAGARPPDEPGGLEGAGGQGQLHDLPYAAFMTMLGLYGQVPVELFDDPTAVELAETSLRADFALVETHRTATEPVLTCPLTALAGLADTSVRPGAMRGWQRLTAGGFTFRPVPGEHFFVNERTEEITGVVRQALLGP